MTNGKGMMKFSRGFMRFGKGLPIVPCALNVHTSFGIRTHTLTSSFLANLFWFCFCPVITMEAVVLPPMVPTEVCYWHLTKFFRYRSVQSARVADAEFHDRLRCFFVDVWQWVWMSIALLADVAID